MEQNQIPSLFVPTRVEYEPVPHRVEYQGDRAFASPPEGTLILEVFDAEAVKKWRYSFVVYPKLIVQAPLGDRELEYLRRANELWREYFVA